VASMRSKEGCGSHDEFRGGQQGLRGGRRGTANARERSRGPGEALRGLGGRCGLARSWGVCCGPAKSWGAFVMISMIEFEKRTMKKITAIRVRVI